MSCRIIVLRFPPRRHGTSKALYKLRYPKLFDPNILDPNDVGVRGTLGLPRAEDLLGCRVISQSTTNFLSKALLCEII